MFVELLLKVVDEEIHGLLQLIKRHVIALTALGLLFERLK